MKKIKKILSLITIYITVFVPLGVQATEVRDIVFPIGEDWDYNFSDTYGADRSGGRVHLGTDIMVDQMAPLLAAVDGRVSYLVDKDQGWGLAIYIEDEEGYSYRYLHINNDTPGTDDGAELRFYAFPKNIVRGAEVKAGQLIAFAGDSGNAEWVGHHLHFEIWTPEKESINSYPSLMAALNRPVETTEEVDENISYSSYKFTRNLKQGDQHEEVRQLQKYLNGNGYTVSASGAGSAGNETNYFGPATQRALMSFQAANGIEPAAGYFGPITRAFIESHDNDTANSNLQAGWLVKDKLSPKVYYVNDSLELRWVVSEEIAIREFGLDWATGIKELANLDQYIFGNDLK